MFVTPFATLSRRSDGLRGPAGQLRVLAPAPLGQRILVSHFFSTLLVAYMAEAGTLRGDEDTGHG